MLSVRTLAATLICVAAPLTAKADASIEKKLQSALLLQFVKLTEFKAPTTSALDTITIAVADDPDLKSQLNDIASGKKVKGKRIEVDDMTGDKPSRPSHVVFLGGGANAEKKIASLSGCGCLVVTFAEGLAKKGAVINFVLDGGSMKFELSPKAAGQQSLELGADLLKLGKSVD